MSVFAEVVAGAAPLIAAPDAGWLEHFGAPNVGAWIVPAPTEPTIHVPTFADCVRFGGFPDLPEPSGWGETEPNACYRVDRATGPEWTAFMAAVPLTADLFRREYEVQWTTQTEPVEPTSLTLDMLQRSYDALFARQEDTYRRYADVINRWFAPRPAVRGDHESAVDPGIVKELVALAKAGNREDFDFLAGSAGVEDRDALWDGTRARLGPRAEPPGGRPS